MSKLKAAWHGKPSPPPTNGTVKVAPVGQANNYVRRAIEAEVQAILDAPRPRGDESGGRNDQLNKSAFNLGTLVGAGHLDHADAETALHDAGLAAGLARGEVVATTHSGLSKGALKPRDIPERPDIPNVTVLDIPEATQGELDDFWGSRELLTHLHTYAQARMVAPWAVFGNTLARVLTATPYFFVLPPIIGVRASLNSFFGMVGPSGAGKGAAAGVAAEALNVGHITVHKPGSGEGIIHSYMKRNKGVLEQIEEACLFQVAEIDSLAALGARQGATLMPELRSAWSGEQLGFSYADPTKRLEVPANKYRLVLVMGIQPARAAVLLDDVDGGTPQRISWLDTIDRHAPAVLPDCPDPIVWTPPDFGRQSRVWSVGGTVDLAVCQTAKDVIVDARQANNRGDADALDGHALLCQLKVAAGLAILDGRLDVTDDDWYLSGIVAKVSTAVRASVQRTLADAASARNHGRAKAEAERTLVVSETVHEAAMQTVSRGVVRTLRRHGGEMTRSTLRKGSCRSDHRRYFDGALERLVDVGQVVVSATEHGHICKLTEAEG